MTGSPPAPEAVYDLLYQIGLSARSTAFFHLAYTVRLAAAQPQRLLVAEWLYPETARHYRTTSKAVENSVRKLGFQVWRREPEKLARLAGAPLNSPPPPARFLAILAAALRENSAA